MASRTPPPCTLTDLAALPAAQEAAAALLVEGFRDHWPDAWPDLDSARQEVAGMLAAERLARAALAPDGTLLGWIGGIPEYDGLVWELHPLVVRADGRGQGVGRALVANLETLCAARGGLTLMLGTDDEDGMTTLAGADLYPDVLGALAAIQDRKGHPFGFYRRCGFSLIGVIPDANGRGKPDILMGKRIGK